MTIQDEGMRLSDSKQHQPALSGKARQRAEAVCSEHGERLTPGRAAAYAALLENDKPLSAYDLIAQLEKQQDRKIAPLTVYRHLDFLMRVGLVHRLQSTQSYLPCDHPEHDHKSQYLLCSSCGQVDELESKTIEVLLSEIAAARGFRPKNAVVEVEGMCEVCAEQTADAGG